ncbi:MAG: YebC/PmpR family DNA-binding transcriptional regulator [Patescibacteria group bacterium]
MSGHNKWSQIKRQKGKTDAQKSKMYSKHARLISLESKKANGNLNSPGLLGVIDKAKKENVPKDVIERAIKKGTEAGGGIMESITYEAYGPGGCAIVIEALTDNRNKAAQEIKHILSEYNISLAGIGSATWAFTRTGSELHPTVTIPLGEDDLSILDKIVDALEDNDEVQNVFTNAE